MIKDLITIILTVYNGEKFLKEQLDSIINQDYRPIRIQIFDDVSTDNSFKIIQDYLLKYDFINFYQNKRRLGVVKNFEQALEICDTSYIALADQDDIWYKNKLTLSMNTMKIHEKDYPNIPLLVHSDLELITEEGNQLHSSYFKFRNYYLPLDKSLNIIISQNGVMGNTILMNAQLKKAILPFPKYLAVHDYWIALINEIYGKRITIYQPLVQYRLHHSNTSNNINIFKNSYKNYIKKFLSFNFHLPYMGIHRNKTLQELLIRYQIPQEDRKIIEKFLLYLNFRTNRLRLFYILIKYNFVKRGIFYRVMLFFLILIF